MVLQRDHWRFIVSPVQFATRTVAFRDFETWVRITTPTEPRPDTHPLFVLHGGPGMAHDYVRNIAELADETGRTVVHYDQVGCGHSTHLPDKPADFWTPELFVDEFHTVRTRIGDRAVPPAGTVLGRHARRRDLGPSACGPGLPVDLQLTGIDGSVGRGRRRAPRSTARRDPGRPGPPRGRRHRHRSGVPRRDGGVLPPPRVPRRAHPQPTSWTARSRWRPSRPSTTP